MQYSHYGSRVKKSPSPQNKRYGLLCQDQSDAKIAIFETNKRKSTKNAKRCTLTFQINCPIIKLRIQFTVSSPLGCSPSSSLDCRNNDDSPVPPVHIKFGFPEIVYPSVHVNVQFSPVFLPLQLPMVRPVILDRSGSLQTTAQYEKINYIFITCYDSRAG